MITFDRDPAGYQHWRLSFDGPVATLTLDVNEDRGIDEGYKLKLNSYDLGVDIELRDALDRIRFEHPEVGAVVLASGKERMFCAGANIYMLGQSTHSFKVNFCKFTNETRIYLEDASANSGLASLAACKGTTAGGGYELALACDEILLVDDGNSAVSFPETPLLAVLPGTGGLTRLVDKRKVRRDRADVFCTLAEGFKGKRAKDWGFVDGLVARTSWDKTVKERAQALAAKQTVKRGPGIKLMPVEPKVSADALTYQWVTLSIDRAARTANLEIRGPFSTDSFEPGAHYPWSLEAFRELDDALLHLRINHQEVGVVLVRAEGDAKTVLAHDAALVKARDHWFTREILLHMARVLRRLDNTSRSFFALGDRGTAFAGCLLELALAADRFYVLEDEDAPVHVALSELNEGALLMHNGLTRLQTRLLGTPAQLEALVGRRDLLDPEAADEAGLVTVRLDAIDWDDDLRIAVEERASISPDALTGMEQNLRFPGPETPDSKIYARLSAWQNWIFIRPNATGPEGALTLYGRPERPRFDWHRV